MSTPIAGQFNTTPPTVGSGQTVNVQVDASGRLLAVMQEEAAGSSTVTSVPSSATNVTLLAASPGRLHASIYNSDANALLIKFGATASASSYSYRLATGVTWEMPFRYVGIIDGIWETAGSGAAKITSFDA